MFGKVYNILGRINGYMRTIYEIFGQGALFYFDKKEFIVHGMLQLDYNCQYLKILMSLHGIPTREKNKVTNYSDEHR